MEIDLQTLLPRIIIALPIGIGAVVLIIIGIKRINAFFMAEYQGNSKERFKDNLVGNLLMALGIGCFLLAFFVFQIGKLSWGLIPLSFCFVALIVPILVLGAYWRSYMTNKLWGGLMPILREKYGYTQSEQAKQNKIDPSKIKLTRRTTLTAIFIALFVFFGLYYILTKIGWNGGPWSGIMFKLLFSGFMAFGIFMTIASAALSRRIQKLRNGEPLDDDDDF